VEIKGGVRLPDGVMIPRCAGFQRFRRCLVGDDESAPILKGAKPADLPVVAANEVRARD
jgi:hypothetical protein